MTAVLDVPADTDVVDRFGFSVQGWVWLGVEQERIAAVELWSGGTLLGESGTLAIRPDVCAALGVPNDSRTGYQLLAHHPAALRGARIDLQVRLRFRDGTRTEPLCSRSIDTVGFDEAASILPAVSLPTPPEDVSLPPDHLQARQVGGVWGQGFYREGRVILGQVAAAFEGAGRPLGTASAILDFGCGCGRVLRGFADLPHSGEVWGCDIDAEAIAWNDANLGHIGRFRVNPPVPPTSFVNGHFDAIYAVSVFTHLPEELQFAWLTELRRILRPGGILVASVHGGHYWCNADAGVRTEVATRGFAYRTGAVTPGLPDFYMVAFHSEAYIRAKWSRFFEFMAIKEKYIHYVHDAIVMRRPPD